jgi:cell division transport system permease protein
MAYHAQAAMSSLLYLCRQPLATGMTVVVIAITLTLPALLWVFNDNMAELTRNWKRGGHISLYLDMQMATSEAALLLERVRQTDGVGEALMKSPAEGLLEMQHQEGMQDLMLNLPENPLPAVIDVIPAFGVTTSAQLEALYARLKALPGIEDARLDMQWVSRLYALLDLAAQLTHGLMVLLSVAVVFIIGNTLRLVIHKRHEEIQVLKLIGASDPYIIRPFLYSGLWYGLASALLAVILVSLFMLSLGVVLNQLIEAYQMHFPVLGLSIRQALLLILMATFLGWLGARFSVKRQLALIEP